MIQIQVLCVHYYTELGSVVLYGYTKKKSWRGNDSDTGIMCTLLHRAGLCSFIWLYLKAELEREKLRYRYDM